LIESAGIIGNVVLPQDDVVGIIHLDAGLILRAAAFHRGDVVGGVGGDRRAGGHVLAALRREIALVHRVERLRRIIYAKGNRAPFSIVSVVARALNIVVVVGQSLGLFAFCFALA